jgi:glutathione S-transferase
MTNNLTNPERIPIPMTSAPLSWRELETLTDYQIDPVNGLTNAQARLRLFGLPQADVRVTLYRDNHAWCPYCQKVQGATKALEGLLYKV